MYICVGVGEKKVHILYIFQVYIILNLLKSRNGINLDRVRQRRAMTWAVSVLDRKITKEVCGKGKQSQSEDE